MIDIHGMEIILDAHFGSVKVSSSKSMMRNGLIYIFRKRVFSSVLHIGQSNLGPDQREGVALEKHLGMAG